MAITEEVEYGVNLTLRLSIPINFAACQRDGEVTKSDAIENAIASLPSVTFPDGRTVDLVEFLGNYGFEVATPIDGEAEELGREVFSIGTPS